MIAFQSCQGVWHYWWVFRVITTRVNNVFLCLNVFFLHISSNGQFCYLIFNIILVSRFLFLVLLRHLNYIFNFILLSFILPISANLIFILSTLLVNPSTVLSRRQTFSMLSACGYRNIPRPIYPHFKRQICIHHLGCIIFIILNFFAFPFSVCYFVQEMFTFRTGE